MNRSYLPLRLASAAVLLAACAGDTPIESETSGDSSTDVETSTTNPTTTNPDLTTGPGPDSTSTTTATSSTGPDPDTTTPPDDTTATTTTGPDTSTSDTSTSDTSTSDTSTSDTSSTTDTSTSEPVLCGNGALDEGEACDGTDLAGETCQSQGFDDGELACAADCTFDATACVVATCGDATIQGAEVCDGDNLGGATCESQGFLGGTLACADGCAAYDTTACTNCGDNTQSDGEACDGTDLAGETCVSQGFVDGELACTAECTFDIAACGTCGNDVVDGDDLCDGVDLDGATCVSLGGGNTGGTLKCTSACAFDEFLCDAAVDESEPNDDTMVAVSTNDFSAANADGPFAKHVLIKAAISPAGDDDVFAVTNPTDGPVSLKMETFGPGGVGTCVGPDTEIFVRNADGTQLAYVDQGGIANCSKLDNFVLTPGQTVYVQVTDYLDNTAIASYYLDLKMTPIVCGDGAAVGNEQCDDGNTAPGDGCSAQCQIEGTAEIEPNNTNPQADANGIVSTGDSVFLGAVTPNADLDRYRLDIAATQYIRFETFTKLNDCTTGNDTLLRLLDSAGTALTTDTTLNDGGIGTCSALVFPLTPGTYYIEASESGNNAAIPFYYLELAPQTDQGVETEPNDTRPTANTNIQTAGSDVFVYGDHALAADQDWFAIDVPAGASLRLETIEGDRTVETCEGLDLDPEITLYNSTGTELANNADGGRGYCSLIDGTGATPANAGAHNLAAGTYYVQVRADDNADATQAVFIYRLAVSIRKP